MKFMWRLLSLPVFLVCCPPLSTVIIFGAAYAGVKWVCTGRGSLDDLEDTVEWFMRPVDYVWTKAGII